MKIIEKTKFGNLLVLTLDGNVMEYSGKSKNVRIGDKIYPWNPVSNVPTDIGIKADDVSSNEVEFLE